MTCRRATGRRQRARRGGRGIGVFTRPIERVVLLDRSRRSPRGRAESARLAEARVSTVAAPLWTESQDD